MVRPKDPWNSFAWYIDAETFKFRLRVTSKFSYWRYCTWTLKCLCTILQVSVCIAHTAHELSTILQVSICIAHAAHELCTILQVSICIAHTACELCTILQVSVCIAHTAHELCTILQVSVCIFHCWIQFHSIIFWLVFIRELHIKESKKSWRVIKKCIAH